MQLFYDALLSKCKVLYDLYLHLKYLIKLFEINIMLIVDITVRNFSNDALKDWQTCILFIFKGSEECDDIIFKLLSADSIDEI